MTESSILHVWAGQAAGGAVPGQRLKVLIVDDEEAVVRHLADGLNLLGFATDVAHSASEALLRLEADPGIGVVVTDVRMPGGDGLLLAQRILRERRGLSALKVILITGHATLNDGAAAVRAGVSDFIRKPFRLAEAAAAVRVALDAAEAARAEEAHRLDRMARIGELERLRDELASRLTPTEALLRVSPDTASVYSPNLAADVRAISHALRTPLNHIAGGAELLAADGHHRQESGLDYLRNGLRDAVQAVELVEELHLAGQPTGASLQDDVDLAMVAASVVRQLARPCTEKGVSLTLLPAAAVPRTRGSEAVVHRILMHATRSALDWIPHGGSIEIELAQPTEKEGHRWCTVTVLSCTDRQSPIPPAGLTFPKTSSPFRDTHEGLRYAITRRLVANIDGAVTTWSPDRRTMAIRIALPG